MSFSGSLAWARDCVGHSGMQKSLRQQRLLVPPPHVPTGYPRGHLQSMWTIRGQWLPPLSTDLSCLRTPSG